ncbi:hypothetical protein MCGE09_00008 [Thaumarchaeota archaeon SCGC AB-539-E09]|nr:hypothetical protein MCGE09_00008 [Thaumarchaeota archaeon SCGC AB-539-E09]
MDPLLRGVCEQYIDNKLEGDEVRKIRKLVDILDIPFSSKEDVALGLFMGTIFSYIHNHYMSMYNRQPKKNEILEYHHILRRRADEIKSMFNLGPQNKWEPDLEFVQENNLDETPPEDVEEVEENDEKFSFDSNARNEPASNILGIPTSEKPPIPLPT